MTDSTIATSSILQTLSPDGTAATAATTATTTAATTGATTAATTATTTAPATTSTDPTQTAPLKPGAPGVVPDPSAAPTELVDMPGGWQVSPDQVKAFADAVAQVRNDLDTVFRQVDQLTSPDYQPQLGSSPVGQALTGKFVDRLSGGQGLLANLNVVLQHLDDFVTNAEQTAQQYQETEQSTTDTLTKTL